MDVNITYETLFDTLRKEKSSEELQFLEDNFYDDANKYLSEKQQTFLQNNDIKTQKQIHNIKKLLKEIFERRQRKILILSFNQGRTENDLLTNKLLQEEKYFYENILSTIKKFNSFLEKTVFSNKNTELTSKNVSKNIEQKEIDTEKKIKVCMITKLPKFLGKDLESYGPYEKDNIVELPEQLANILIDKKRAKKV